MVPGDGMWTMTCLDVWDGVPQVSGPYPSLGYTPQDICAPVFDPTDTPGRRDLVSPVGEGLKCQGLGVVLEDPGSSTGRERPTTGGRGGG